MRQGKACWATLLVGCIAAAGCNRDVLVDAGSAIDLSVDDLTPPADLAISPDLAVTAALCLGGGNVFYVDGEPDSLAPGISAVHVDHWVVDPGYPDLNHLFAYDWQDPNDPIDKWAFYFSSIELNQPLMVRRYDPAEGFPLTGDNSPGLDVMTPHGGCELQGEYGWFEIEELAGGPQNGSFTRLTATFELHCKNKSGALRGCIHFEN